MAEKEYSAARAHINEMATTVPDETLKGLFLQGALGYLRWFPKPPAAGNEEN